MANLIYTGLEPDSLDGNNTIQTADTAGSIGAFPTANSESALVFDQLTFTGTTQIVSEDGQAEGPDPADFVIFDVGSLTNQVAVGVEMHFENALSSHLGNGIAGGAYQLNIEVSGSTTKSHSLVVAWGVEAAGSELIQFAESRLIADNLRTTAISLTVADDPSDPYFSAADETLLSSFNAGFSKIEEIYDELVLGQFEDNSEAWKTQSLYELQQIVDAAEGGADPIIFALGQLINGMAQDLVTLIEASWEVDVYFDGRIVDPAQHEDLHLTQFDLEWRKDFDVLGDDLVFQISGGMQSTRFVEDEFWPILYPSLSYSEIDYGAGAQLISYTIPAAGTQGSIEHDVFDGSSASETFYGHQGNDALSGLGGSDMLMGGAGLDTLSGGNGNDTLNGGDGSDTVIGGDGGDLIAGGAEGDTLLGGAGADSVLGGDGADDINSGVGNDTADGGNGDDTINTGNGADSVLGGSGSDSILSGDASDTILGGSGDDFVDGQRANDSILGGTGNDTLKGFIGIDTIDGGSGHDSIVGGLGDDILFGGVGDDEIFGSDGADSIDGEAGNDSIYTGIGPDTAIGGEGNDTLMGGKGRDSLEGGSGMDSLLGGLSRDTLFGGDGDDTLSGGAQDDRISGGLGNDLVLGGSGADILAGNEGDDTLDGGDGADVYAFVQFGGSDTIQNFELGADRLLLDEALWGFGLDAQTVVSDYAAPDNGNTLFSFGFFDSITVEGVADPNSLLPYLDFF